MQWEVSGADRTTGEDRTITVEADNEASASRRASRQGLMVADVRALDPNDSVAPAIVAPRSRKPVHRPNGPHSAAAKAVTQKPKAKPPYLWSAVGTAVVVVLGVGVWLAKGGHESPAPSQQVTKPPPQAATIAPNTPLVPTQANAAASQPPAVASAPQSAIVPSPHVEYSGGNLAREMARLEKSVATDFPHLDPDELIGKKFIISQNSAYEDRPDAQFLSLDDPNDALSHPIYRDVVGRRCTLISRDQSGTPATIRIDGDPKTYTTFCFEDIPQGLILASDVDNAKARWKGKTLWIRSTEILVDAPGKKIASIKLKHWTPATVADVQPGSFEPVRLVLDAGAGRVGYLETPVSGSTTSPTLLDIFAFHLNFLEREPRIVCPYPAEVWSDLENGVIAIGMNKEEVSLSWGIPKDIRTTTTADGKQEQWIFGNDRYVYLTNGVVTSIQN